MATLNTNNSHREACYMVGGLEELEVGEKVKIYVFCLFGWDSIGHDPLILIEEV